MPIHGNRHGLHAFQFLAYGNRYRCRIRVTNIYPEVQSVRVHGSQSNHLLPEYIQTLIIVLCVEILICTNGTEWHWTRITREANTSKQRAR